MSHDDAEAAADDLAGDATLAACSARLTRAPSLTPFHGHDGSSTEFLAWLNGLDHGPGVRDAAGADAYVKAATKAILTIGWNGVAGVLPLELFKHNHERVVLSGSLVLLALEAALGEDPAAALRGLSPGDALEYTRCVGPAEDAVRAAVGKDTLLPAHRREGFPDFRP